MNNKDIRWQQRLSNLKLALGQLGDAVELAKQRDLSLLEQQGLIQAFEFTHELSWNVIKDYFYFQGNSAITGSRDASREAFKTGLIQSGDIWMEMIQSRNRTSHTYNRELAEKISQRILKAYFPAFKLFFNKMESLKE
ncbi:MAG: hypothetical protein S4CHLAM7_02010 [Chlamydiae bacterium]|nr:hypothetical protein [Chlamydiota bacterium]